MMLEQLGLKDSALQVRNAVAKVLKAGKPRTPDLGGTDSSAAITEAILAAL
jgi:isocitrate/isopropylmalate dehydrogenase